MTDARFNMWNGCRPADMPERCDPSNPPYKAAMLAGLLPGVSEWTHADAARRAAKLKAAAEKRAAEQHEAERLERVKERAPIAAEIRAAQLAELQQENERLKAALLRQQNRGVRLGRGGFNVFGRKTRPQNRL